MKGAMLLSRVSLSYWAGLGLIALLCLPWLLSSKHYHQAVIALLWLPVIPALFRADFRAAVKQPELLLFGVFLAWTWLVLAVKGSDELSSDIKVTVYVSLSLLGIVLASLGKTRIETWLFAAAVFGGVLALFSVLDFYQLHWFTSPGPRLIAVGVWDTAIMAAHAVGVLGLFALFLTPSQRLKPWQLAVLLIAALGYLAFLGLSQTRGVWVALLAVLLVMVVVRRSRRGYYLIAAGVVGVVLIAVLHPEILTQRGASFRPTLWRGGWQLMRDNWALGYGFNGFTIYVAELDRFFKHPHNLFLNIGAREGVIGLALYLALWASVAWRAWTNRAEPLGQALLAVWVFATVALMTDGIGLWFKPNADWLVTWVPIALSLVLANRQTLAQQEKLPEPLQV